jgi:uncharacterized protein (DUF433 family)
MKLGNRTLIGIGLYTPAEAGRLIEVSSARLVRWLRGHDVKGKRYDPLWEPEVNLDDEKTYLSFRDLLEARVAARFIDQGLSAQKVRRAIQLASEVVGERPLSTTWLKTDGRSVFLEVIREDGNEPGLLDLFKRQYAFNAIVERSLRDIDFDGPMPKIWWPRGRAMGVLIDPLRSFGQPIERDTSIPAETLANAAVAEGSAQAAARAWCVPVQAVRRAVIFQRQVEKKKAA